MRTPQGSVVTRLVKGTGKPSLRILRRPDSPVNQLSSLTPSGVESERAVLMVSRNYKVAASIGFGKAELHPVPTVLDTGCV